MEFNTTDHKQVSNISDNLKGQKGFPILQVCTWPFSLHLTEVTFTFFPVSLSTDYQFFRGLGFCGCGFVFQAPTILVEGKMVRILKDEEGGKLTQGIRKKKKTNKPPYKGT